MDSTRQLRGSKIRIALTIDESVLCHVVKVVVDKLKAYCHGDHESGRHGLQISRAVNSYTKAVGPFSIFLVYISTKREAFSCWIDLGFFVMKFDRMNFQKPRTSF